MYKAFIWHRIIQVWKINLPIAFLCYKNVCLLALVVVWINPTKRNFTTHFFLYIAIKPKWKYLFLGKTLFDHVVLVRKTTGPWEAHNIKKHLKNRLTIKMQTYHTGTAFPTEISWNPSPNITSNLATRNVTPGSLVASINSW